MSGPSETRLRILTLNCWGLKYVSKQRSERIAAIASALAASDYDIITLQEVWVFNDYEHIRAAVSKRLPYAKYFYSGALGAGLVTLSRFPIVASTIHPYSLNGSPIDVLGGDWFVGKAAASVLVAHPILGQVQVFNTHLYAKGADGGPEHERAHRLVNAWEMAKLARQAAEMGRYVLAAGDFNSIPDALPMSIIREHAGLGDAWCATHPDVPPPAGTPSPVDAIALYGVTCDSPLNTYSAGKPLDAAARRMQGKRLDYVLYRAPSSPPASARTPALACVESRVVFTGVVPGTQFSYSDHFGLEATFSIALPHGGDVTDPAETYIPAPARPRTPSFVLPSVPNPQPVPSRYLSPASVTAMLQSLTTCYRHALSRARFQLMVFTGALIVLVFFLAISVWIPFWFSPVFVLLTIVLSWLATTMLYVGFVYGRWEVNALMNVIEELEIYRDNLAEQQGEGIGRS
ncbi:DNase I-like protein [Obba rivulosa]|uniref:DNase I-like protein n=1 Tax=Obba rivulosa TaxID=1052685 RepID=A0A8E2J6K5_9APHY|nr:DNase I-like protein [Obba rivulosa]